MREITSDRFYDLAGQYDSDDGHHLVGEVDYHLLRDEKPCNRLQSHRDALLAVFDRLAAGIVEEQAKVRETLGDRVADRLRPWVYDVWKARPTPVDPRVFFYCPNIVKIGYYGNVAYDAAWKPNDENFGTTVPYWYALMEPVHGGRHRPEDFRKVNAALFPNGTDKLEIYEWTTDWSDYFDAGHEWYGACCWSVYDAGMDRMVVMLVSATD